MRTITVAHVDRDLKIRNAATETRVDDRRDVKMGGPQQGVIQEAATAKAQQAQAILADRLENTQETMGANSLMVQVWDAEGQE